MYYQIIKNIFYKFLGVGFSRVFTFIFFIYVARLLGDSNFGAYTFAMNFASLFFIFADLGLNTILIRDVSINKDKLITYLGNIATIKIFLSILIFNIMTITISFTFNSSELIFITQIAGLICIISSLIELCNAVFNSINKMDLEMWIRFIDKITIILLGTISLLFLPTPQSLILSILSGILITFGISIYFFKINNIKFKLFFNTKFLLPLLPQGIQMALAYIFAFIYAKIDLIMIYYILESTKIIGWYSSANRLIDAINLIPYLVVSAVFPVLSNLYTKDKRLFIIILKIIFGVFILLSLILTVIGINLSFNIIYWLYGVEFINAVDIFNILILMLPFIFINYLYNIFFIILKKQSFIAVNGVISIFINISLNLYLIPIYNYQGVALATVLSTGILSLLNSFYGFLIYKKDFK